MRHAKFHSRDNLLAMVDGLADAGFLGFDVTGGEPTLHPDIVEVIHYATTRGLSSRIITLGQWLMRTMKRTEGRRLIDCLFDAGLTNFLFSYHAAEPGLFEKITGESLDKLQSAMHYCDERNFDYTTNTTVFEDNYKHLAGIARQLTHHRTYLHNFIVQNAYYEWGRNGRTEGVQAHYGAIAPYLKEAIDILEDAGIGVNVRYVPLCAMAGYEKNIVGILGVRYDPYEWMNCIDHKADPEKLTLEQAKAMGNRIPMKPGEAPPGAVLFGVKGDAKGVVVGAARGIPSSQPQVSKLFPSGCKICTQINVCDGVDPNYLGLRGAGEFVPYHAAEGPAGPLHPERLAYRAPFFVKRRADADMRSVVKRAMQPPRMSKQPLVSVVVTCFNYGRYLKQCLNSLLAQSYSPIEIILVDDGSIDATAEIARYPEYVVGGVNYRYQPNSGQPAGPRNLGITESKGELIVCLDADDWLEPSCIEEMVRIFHRHPEASIVYPGTQCRNDDGTIAEADIFMAAPWDYEMLTHECRVVCVSMFRRSMWEEVGGYRLNIRGSEDWNFWVEAAGLGHVGVALPRQLFNYRRHSDGIFETDVKPNFPHKVRQLILNNPDLYPPALLRQAQSGEGISWGVAD